MIKKSEKLAPLSLSSLPLYSPFGHGFKSALLEFQALGGKVSTFADAAFSLSPVNEYFPHFSSSP